MREGLHFGAPGYRFITFSSIFQTVSYSKVTCLNKDGLVIDLDVQFQYRVDPNNLKSVILEFRDAGKYEEVVRYCTNVIYLIIYRNEYLYIRDYFITLNYYIKQVSKFDRQEYSCRSFNQ